MSQQPQAFLTWDADGTLVSTTCDVITDWTDTREATITRRPVEDGSQITDHIAPMPPTLTVSVAISQTPLYGGKLQDLARNVEKSRFSPAGLFALTQAAGALIGAGLDALGFGAPKTGFQTYQFADDSGDPGNDLHDKLIEALDNGYRVKLSLGVNRNSERPYEDYNIERIVKSVTTDDGEMSRFEITLVKMKTVQTDFALLPVPAALPIAKLGAALKLGKTPATVRDDPDTSAQKSLLASLSDATGFGSPGG